MNDSHYIDLGGASAIIVSRNEDAISIGVHVEGGHARVDLTQKKALEVIQAIESIEARIEEGEE